VTALPAGLLSPADRVERFFRRFLTHGKGQFAGRAFNLEPWQRTDLIEPIFDPLVERGGRLLRVVTEGMAGIAKKNGKSTTSAGLGAYGLFADGHYVADAGAPGGWYWQREVGAEVYNVAGSRDQAKVLFNMASSMVRRSPLLAAQAKVYRDAIEVPKTESVWRVMASDASLAHGPSPSLAILDELWVHTSPELYEAFAAAGAARLQPLVISITTAGWNKDGIAYALYERGRRNRSRSFHFVWYQAKEGTAADDRAGWRAANPSRWVTAAYMDSELKRARALGNEAQFRRWHLNQWSSGEELALPVELWDACGGRPRIPDGARVVLGVDSAPKRDSTAVAVVHLDADRVHHVRVAHMNADPDTGYLDYAALEDLLRELARRYEVERILVDPFNMMRSLTMLLDEGLPVEEFPQTDARMMPASMNLYELVYARRLRHGNARELRIQAMNAGKRTSERGWRFEKRKSAGVIDGIVALAIATYEVERADEATPRPVLFV
jgi:phage terminase large subunit-like protein